MEHGLSCSVACGIFPDRGWNPSLLCLLYRQANSSPLSHQGSPLKGSLALKGSLTLAVQRPPLPRGVNSSDEQVQFLPEPQQHPMWSWV